MSSHLPVVLGGENFPGTTTTSTFSMERLIKLWFRDHRVGVFLLVWALCMTCWNFLSTPTRSALVLPESKKDCPYRWAGGSPSQSHAGSCWCGWDTYCLCTPSLAIDAIIEVPVRGGNENDVSIILVHRRDPPKDLYAIPGGFVDVGESVEAATVREVKEETNLDLVHLEQFRLYSDPQRDKRRHTVSSVFRCVAKDIGRLHKGDDAKSVRIVRIVDALSLELAFDHRTILTDYIKNYHPKLVVKQADH